MKINYSLPFIAGILMTGAVWAQETDAPKSKSPKPEMPKNWHHLDYAAQGYSGISLNKAYDFLQAKKRNSKRITVAVIDSGIDSVHEDIKPVLWVNNKEIPGNKIDDDGNGYVDDIHGWNFLGGKDGKNVNEDSYEAARVYHNLKATWENFTGKASSLKGAKKMEYEMFLRAKDEVAGEDNKEETEFIKNLQPKLHKGDSVLRAELGKEKYTAADLKEFKPSTPEAKNMRMFLMRVAGQNDNTDITNEQLLEEIDGAVRKADASNNAPEPFRQQVVGDDESDFNDRSYGNNDLMAKTPFHGTHCAGIIGAARGNGLGVEGVADNVNIMVLRAVPDGDEHDKDIAHAVRYAVDNGARVISMSFGKAFSPNKQWVDDAFRYADKKGVLLVHAAGNDAKNIDSTFNFPNPNYLTGKGKKKRTKNIITVGASGDSLNGGLTAAFSNYGKKEVDVFAPGVGIYSTIPGGDTYGNASGTSMACPVVAGLAALIMEYYPELNASEVKQAIEESVVQPANPVKKPGTNEKVSMSELSRTGGIINAYAAVVKSDEMASKKKKK